MHHINTSTRAVFGALEVLAAAKGLSLSEPFQLDGARYSLRCLKDGRLVVVPVFASNDLDEIAKYIVGADVVVTPQVQLADEPEGLCGEIALTSPNACVMGMDVSSVGFGDVCVGAFRRKELFPEPFFAYVEIPLLDNSCRGRSLSDNLCADVALDPQYQSVELSFEEQKERIIWTALEFYAKHPAPGEGQGHESMAAKALAALAVLGGKTGRQLAGPA